MKNLVLCCDGTANEFASDRTNVIKLFSALVQDPVLQAVYYHPGLGTMEPAGALTSFTRRLTRFLGKAVGFGLEADVRDAYIFLMNNFESEDRIFLFGFSRGAYTVRAVASLLHMYGLLPRGNDALVPYAIRMLGGVNNKDTQKHEYFKLASDFKSAFGMQRPAKPWFVGVWDTVSSVGWLENQLRLPYTANNPDIEYGRHAIAIDERRAFFRTNLWSSNNENAVRGPRDLKQVWFPGVHCDVGGGYPEVESGLSKIALGWMLREAKSAGLLTDIAKEDNVMGRNNNDYVKPNPASPSHTSLTASWWPAEFVLKRHFDWKSHSWRRRPNLGRRRTIPAGSLVHSSVFQRGEQYSRLVPQDAIAVD